eukprot:m.22026 g.22026  ORF g.22026 m.22026 type:complete len:357 (-) comp12596_c0_seq1:461-1531(-)
MASQVIKYGLHASPAIRQAVAEKGNKLFEQVVVGDRGGLARAITLAESRSAKWRSVGQHVVSRALEHNKGRRTFRIGLSGPPGAGKSTFIESFGRMLTQSSETHRLAVLSIDPSSSVTGGSILGDKTRMPHLSVNPRAYIRPSPSSCTLGGVARSTCDSVVLCEAAGFDTVLIETVGVGQSETAVADMVDLFVLIVPPAGGDVLQGLKRGIVELADMVIVNKADGDLLAPARRTKMEYLSALKLIRNRTPLWNPPVLSVSSLEHKNIDDVWTSMQDYQDIMETSGRLHQKRSQQSKTWMWQMITDQIVQRFQNSAKVAKMIPEVETQVRSGDLTAGQGAEILLDACNLSTLVCDTA